MTNDPLVRAGFFSSWGRFWFNPVDPLPLHLLRVLTGLLVLSWLLGFAGHQDEFYGLKGWIDRQAYRDARKMAEQVPVPGQMPPDQLPVPISWSLLYACNGDPTMMNVFYYGSLAIVGLFTLGLAPRLTALMTWLIVASFVSSPAVSYEGEYLLLILSFYLMAGYLLLGLWNGTGTLWSYLLGSRDALAWRLWRSQAGDEARPSIAANLALRLIQVHFAMVVVVSALHKLQLGDWWAGLALWYPLHPPMSTTPEQIRAEAAYRDTYLFFLSLAQYVVLVWQLAFPFLAWRRGWRPVLLGGAAVYWAGSTLLYRLPVFGPVVFLASLSFVSADEWRWFGNGLVRLAHLFRRSKETSVTPELQAQRS